MIAQCYILDPFRVRKTPTVLRTTPQVPVLKLELESAILMDIVVHWPQKTSK